MMKSRRQVARLLLVVLVLALTGTVALAQSITITKVDTSKAGQITVTGSYNLGKDDFHQIAIFARPAGGGKGRGSPPIIGKKMANNTFEGVSSKFEKGKYDVQAYLTTWTKELGFRTYYSDTEKAVEVK
jgi:hypothetical protein